MTPLFPMIGLSSSAQRTHDGITRALGSLDHLSEAEQLLLARNATIDLVGRIGDLSGQADTAIVTLKNIEALCRQATATLTPMVEAGPEPQR